MFVRGLYPSLQYESLRSMASIEEASERRQTLALLSAAYRAVQTETLRTGICSLAILVCTERLQEHNATVEIDVLLETLTIALERGKDAEGALYDIAHRSRRTEARHLRKNKAVGQVLPSATLTKPMLTLPQALAQLNPRYQRVALMLAEGDEAPEIMVEFELSEDAAWQLIARTRAALKKIIS